MAREHARILTSIWNDQHFRARTRDEQWLFFRALSDRHINNAGVLPLFESKWARAAADATIEDIEKARRGLVASRFLVVDEDTDEALVRSFMRGDRVYRQPNVLKNALGEALATESATLRFELAVELLRILTMLPTAKGFESMPEEVRRTVDMLDPEGSARAQIEGSRDPSGNPSSGPSNEPLGNPGIAVGSNPSASRGVGEGAGVGGTSRPVGRSLGGSRASVREAPTPSASGGPPTPSSPRSNDATTSSSPGSMPGFTEQPCGRRHSPDQPCRRCGEVRQARATDDDQARREQAAAVHGCGMCDGDGRLLEVGRFLPVSPTAWCDHDTDHRQQVADARDETS